MLLLILSCTWLVVSVFCALLFRFIQQLAHDIENTYELRLQKNLTDVFMFLPVRQLVKMWLGLVTALLFVCWLVQMNIVIVLLLLGLAGIAPPLAYRYLRRSRQEKFVAQLPDGCLLLANMLRTGATFMKGLQFVQNHAEPPLTQEFSVIVRRLRLGTELTKALAELYKKMPSVELERVIMALLIGQESGGQQAQILEKTAQTLRVRKQLLRRIKSLSAQGRMQGKVMSALPFLLLAMLWLLEPAAMQSILVKPLGWLLLASMLGLILLGQGLIYRTVHIQVPL